MLVVSVLLGQIRGRPSQPVLFRVIARFIELAPWSVRRPFRSHHSFTPDHVFFLPFL